jgi:hypothetical protein
MINLGSRVLLLLGELWSCRPGVGNGEALARTCRLPTRQQVARANSGVSAGGRQRTQRDGEQAGHEQVRGELAELTGRLR